ncbi:GNAT family N-acetyltransferase [Rhodopirellula halodulae]|uniref:GNAT family N-acetyltransferase n=1 Tax=Rhodopirellula halodulae TaxID=2894198 RepID=UPI001E38F72E|nr:hypothetical protein [Rhodopirellula sp. JC737]MCC9658583.1 hypothetical protein [Rhodopirellula sp. JC737]
MATIRPFRNSDLPGLFDVWMRHWESTGQVPPVSVSILERAVLSRTFFRPDSLLVAEHGGDVVGWCHQFSDDWQSPSPEMLGPDSKHDLESVPEVDAVPTSLVAAICFAGEAGLAMCDALLTETMKQAADAGVKRMCVGPVRDARNGYGGLPPIGHGLGIPVTDARVASLLSRHGFHVARSLVRMVVNTSTYRPPMNREFLKLRRSTRIDRLPLLPLNNRTAVAMSHFDMERNVLMDHQSNGELAAIDLWVGDPEGHVMDGARSILSLRLMHPVELNGFPAPQPKKGFVTSMAERELSTHEQFLVASIIQSLANRQIFTVETAIDANAVKLKDQFLYLNFQEHEQGRQWERDL